MLYLTRTLSIYVSSRQGREPFALVAFGGQLLECYRSVAIPSFERMSYFLTG